MEWNQKTFKYVHAITYICSVEINTVNTVIFKGGPFSLSDYFHPVMNVRLVLL